jgi:hypothetical protein
MSSRAFFFVFIASTPCVRFAPSFPILTAVTLVIVAILNVNLQFPKIDAFGKINRRRRMFAFPQCIGPARRRLFFVLFGEKPAEKGCEHLAHSP